MKNGIKTLATWLIIGVIFIVLLSSIMTNTNTKLKYSELIAKINEGKVESIVIDADGTSATVQLSDEKVKKQVNIPNMENFMNYTDEFIKNGACPTFVKRGGNVETLKSVSLPTGILNNIDLVEYNYDLQDGDIVVMCSDGILESNKEYISKDLWMQEILEEIETDDAQKMADLILKEAIDNDFGKEKDDMTVMVYKIHKKNI